MNRLIPYYRARYYSPNIGRFLSRDPLGFMLMMEGAASIFSKLDVIRNLSDLVRQETGTKLDSSSLLNWLSHNTLPGIDLSQGPNLYQYVQSNPVNLTDPSGLAGGGRGSGPRPCPCGTHQVTTWNNTDKAGDVLSTLTGGWWGGAAMTGAAYIPGVNYVDGSWATLATLYSALALAQVKCVPN